MNKDQFKSSGVDTLVLKRAEGPKGHRFEAFLKWALEGERLTLKELEEIHIGLIKLLTDSVERYNRGNSSSIRVEAAQAIMESNLYTINLCLKSCSPDEALIRLKTQSPEELLKEGRRILNLKFKTAVHLYDLVIKTKTQTSNYTYNATLDPGIKGFYSLYKPEFEAHDTPASIDYQLLIPVSEELSGVEYIINYLHRLYMENQFCLRFNPSVIHEVLSGYSIGYKDLLINLCGQLLPNALACVLLEKPVLPLRLIPPDLAGLKQMLLFNEKPCLRLLEEACARMLQVLLLDKKDVKEYFAMALPDLASRIGNSLELDTLHTLFIPGDASFHTKGSRIYYLSVLR